MRIATIIGARPQFIKAAALSRTLKKFSGVREILIHTGQHYDYKMSSLFFEEMEIPDPAYNLGIGGGAQGAMTGRMLEAIENTLVSEKPDWVLVYGDTNSTLAGALAAAKLHIPVAHVEAGLRSFNRRMPEEINRILTDQCSDLLFVPTKSARMQLLTEGVPAEKIVFTGDIMYEAAMYYQQKAYASSSILETLSLIPKYYVLATIHRAENTDDPQRLKDIFDGLNALAESVRVILPLHPRTKLILEKQDWGKQLHANLVLIEPVGYFDMLLLEANAQVILTDSGGVQKEAYFFKVPCLTLRNETEWRELVEQGVNRLVKPQELFSHYQDVIKAKMDFSTAFYGDGQTSEKIIQSVLSTK